VTPEQRAAAFVRERRGFDLNGDVWFIACDRAEKNLASAIREAEDAAIERAAVVVQTKVAMTATTFARAGEMLRDRNGDEHFLGAKSVNELIERKASAIRALKHNKD